MAQGLVASVLGAMVLALSAILLPALRAMAPAPRGLISWMALGVVAATCRTAFAIVKRHSHLGLPGRISVLWVFACAAVWVVGWGRLAGLIGWY